MVRYQGHSAALPPDDPVRPGQPFDFPSRNVIDGRRPPSGGPWGWCRRVRAPTPSSSAAPCSTCSAPRPRPSEVEDFVAEDEDHPGDSDKRARLVDRLLDRPEYVDYWTLKWGDLLRVNSTKLGAQGMLAFNLWLRDASVQQAGQPDGRGAGHGAGVDLHQRPGQLLPRRHHTRRPRRDHRAGLHGRSAPVRQVPPSPVRGLWAGRLLRPGRLLRADADQGERRVRPLRPRASDLRGQQRRGPPAPERPGDEPSPLERRQRRRPDRSTTGPGPLADRRGPAGTPGSPATSSTATGAT